MFSVSNDCINSIVKFHDMTMLILLHTSKDADFYRRLQKYNVKNMTADRQAGATSLLFVITV